MCIDSWLHGKEKRVKITGSYTIDVPRDQVWAALNDIEVLARIVPGCERLVQTGENEYEGTLKIGIQTIKGTYNGRIRIEDIQPPHHYKLVAKGSSPGAQNVHRSDQFVHVDHIAGKIEHVRAFHRRQQATDERLCDIFDVLQIHEAAERDLVGIA